MLIIIVKPLEVEADGACLINIRHLENPYPQFCKEGVSLRVFINRVYNPSKKVVKYPRKTYIFQNQKKREFL
jgi:hypothetical protein